MKTARNYRLAAIMVVLGFAASTVLAQSKSRTSSRAKQKSQLTAKIEQVDGKTNRLVIQGTNRADHVTIKPYEGPVKGGTPTYEVLVKGSNRPVLTFAALDFSGRRVSSVFMNGKRGRDSLVVLEKPKNWDVRTSSVESGPFANPSSGPRKTRRSRGAGR